ncbi:DNA-binding protein [Methylobacterium sp. D48H]
MPTKTEVFAVADRLRAKGERVSLRSVIPKLRAGGSNRIVGPLLRDWKVERSYRPGLEGGDLPERVQGRLAAAAAELWEAAQAEAAAVLTVERERMAAERRAGDEILDEALARLDVAEAEIGRLRERLARLEEFRIEARNAP